MGTKPSEGKKFFLVEYHDDEKKAEIIHDERKNWTTGGNPSIFSISTSHDTEAELRQHRKMPDEPCKICGSPFGTTYNEPTGSKLRLLNICFSCNFWTEKLEQPAGRIIVLGHHFHDAGNVIIEKVHGLGGGPRFLGHGGRKFKIEMKDGTIIETNNLWAQGKIPKHFKLLFPDNAKFLDTGENKGKLFTKLDNL